MTCDRDDTGAAPGASQSAAAGGAVQKDALHRRILDVLESIKFAHTVFALPFALMAAVLAAGGIPDGRTLALILLCMVGARTAAMAFNRLADHELDARNPRTAGRALPAGTLSRRFVWGMVVFGAGAFLLGAAQLNTVCLACSPFVLAVLLAYSYSKRWTAASHFLLGACLGMAPVGAHLAVRGGLAPMAAYAGRFGLPFEALPILIGLAVTLWTAGFDIIYSCQDYEVDVREPGLRSIPKSLGIAKALALSSAAHALCAGLLIGIGVYAGLGLVYCAALGMALGLLVYQHLIVKPNDLSRVNVAFFTANGAVSIVLLAAVLIERVLLGSHP